MFDNIGANYICKKFVFCCFTICALCIHLFLCVCVLVFLFFLLLLLFLILSCFSLLLIFAVLFFCFSLFHSILFIFFLSLSPFFSSCLLLFLFILSLLLHLFTKERYGTWQMLDSVLLSLIYKMTLNTYKIYSIDSRFFTHPVFHSEYTKLIHYKFNIFFSPSAFYHAVF